MVLLKAKELHEQTYPYCSYVCHREGKPFKEIESAWVNACQQIGLKGKTFHDLRRTGVRNLVRAGVSETVAMKISGHKTRSVFDRYNITNEQDLKEAATRLGRYIQEKKVTVSVTLENMSKDPASTDTLQPVEKVGGEGGIRTHGPLPVNGFRDRPIRPLSHLSALDCVLSANNCY